MAGVDPTKVNLLGTNSTGTFAGYLPPEMSAPIFQEAAKTSVAMRLVPQVPLGPTGKAVPIFTGTPVAEWVAESGTKPLTQGSATLKTFKGSKLAAIFVASAEVVRSNPGGFVENMRSKLAESFALAFDHAFFHGLGSGTSASPFAQNLDQTTKVVELGTATAAQGGTYGDIVAGLSLLVADDKKLKSFALDDAIEPLLLTTLDSTGRPIFVETPITETASALRTGTLISRPCVMTDGIKGTSTVLAYGGDFTQAVWGVVGGISYDVSTETALPLGTSGEMLSLWQHNLVAVRAEAEYGYLINDVEAFVKYTDTPAG